MHTYPNQKVIYTHKDETDGRHHLQVTNEEWMLAFQNLNKAAFGIYLYLVKNDVNLKTGWALSPKDIKEKLGIPKGTYKHAIQELEDKGYLTFREENIWDFHSYPNGTANGYSTASGTR